MIKLSLTQGVGCKNEAYLDGGNRCRREAYSHEEGAAYRGLVYTDIYTRKMSWDFFPTCSSQDLRAQLVTTHLCTETYDATYHITSTTLMN